MKTISRQLCSFAMALALAAGLLAVALFASASAIPSTAILSEAARATDLATIRQALESKQVQQRLGELGFTDAEIQQRLANANDTELHQLATQSQAILAGGDGGIIITVLLVMVILRIR